MKKLLFIATMLLACTQLHAQQELKSCSFIPRIGSTASMLLGREINMDDEDFRSSLAIGGEFYNQFSKKVGISVGAFYSQEGSVEHITDGRNIYKATLKLDYLNFPVLFNWYVARNWALKTGLQAGFNLKSAIKVAGVEARVDEGVNGCNISLPIGVSFDSGNFVFDLRYQFGLSNIYRGAVEDTRLYTCMLSMGYRIPMNKKTAVPEM